MIGSDRARWLEAYLGKCGHVLDAITYDFYPMNSLDYHKGVDAANAIMHPAFHDIVRPYYLAPSLPRHCTPPVFKISFLFFGHLGGWLVGWLVGWFYHIHSAPTRRCMG